MPYITCIHIAVVAYVSLCILCIIVYYCVYYVSLYRDLIRKLLVQDRTRRLGNMKNGSADVKGHKWFKEVNWDDVYQRKLKVTEMLFNNLL